MDWQAVDGSFRDPSGFVFTRDGTLYRQVNRPFKAPFDAFIASGLYDDLAGEGLLVPHRNAPLDLAATADACALLEPERIPFVSYPYEWSFGQLRDAALLTLAVHERALTRDFTLRDASAYNVQFRDGHPLFIDTLSFEPREEGSAWVAYRQFCEHFLLPLLLMSRIDVRCGELLRTYLDGVPLELGSRLLSRGSWLNPNILFHVHLHARAQARYAETAVVTARGKRRVMTRDAALALVGGLRRCIERLEWKASGTEWADYVTDNSYSDEAARSKREIITSALAPLKAEMIWDLGANTGEYSRAARETASQVVAFDIDPAAVERDYRRVRAQGETGLLPLLLDLANPSPAQGWAHTERLSLEQRGPADAVLALALVHHLAIGRNVPLDRIASFLSRLGRILVIEFVPKEDVQVRRLLRNRADVFPGYSVEGFEEAFRRYFRITSVQPVADSGRTVYEMTSCHDSAAA
ncbi:MAG: SAM-dependent methyltransferase [Gemmatimonadales bacterium]